MGWATVPERVAQATEGRHGKFLMIIACVYALATSCPTRCNSLQLTATHCNAAIAHYWLSTGQFQLDPRIAVVAGTRAGGGGLGRQRMGSAKY